MEILKQTRLGYGLIGLALLSLGSCKKEGIASLNQDSQITFSVKADLSATTNAISGLSAPAGSSTSPAVTWTDAIANVSKFKFEAKKGNVEKEIAVGGLTNINLFAIDPAAVKSVIDTGTYKEIELKLMLTKSTTSAIPLTLKGTFTATDGTLTPIEINVNEDLIVKVEVENIKIDPSTDFKATFVLGLNKILQGITIADLSAATKTAGKIVISSTSNTALLNKVKLNLQNITGAKVESKHKGGNDDGPGHS